MPLEDDIKQFIQSEIVRDDDIQIENTDSLIRGGIIDSMDLVKVSIFLEKTTGVKLPNIKLNVENMDTIESMVNLVKEESP